MSARWGWAALVGGLVGAALLLAWADSSAFRPLFPQPFEPARDVEIRPPGPGRRGPLFPGLGPVGGLYTFWWFLSVGAGMILVALAVLVALPGRASRAAQRVRLDGLPVMAAAGVSTALLGLAVTVLMRSAFVLLSFVPFLWALAVAGAVFGVAGLALALGRWLRDRLGPAPPLLAALAGLLVLFDAALVPVAGWLALVLLALSGLGLAVLTRLGSDGGWGLDELDW